MVRTQIYLDERQKVKLDRLSAERRITVSDLVRQAIDQYLGRDRSGIGSALEASFGIWKDRDDIGKGSAYVTRLRREWEQRAKRI